MASKEVFRDVVGLEGMYQVSTTGRVKSLSWKRGNTTGIRSETWTPKDMPEKILKVNVNPYKSGEMYHSCVFVSLRTAKGIKSLKNDSKIFHVYDLIKQAFDKRTADKWWAGVLEQHKEKQNEKSPDRVVLHRSGQNG